MDIQAIQQLANLVANSSLYEINLHDGVETIRVRNVSTFKPMNLTQDNTLTRCNTSQHPIQVTANKNNLICSCHIGWLRLAQDTLAQPLVKVGDSIEVGKTLAYVGVLGKLEAVISDTAGKIKAILVENEQAVEYGTPLFELETQ